MAIKTSKSAEGYFTKYKTTNKQATNRKAKLERQLKKQPGNKEQLELAIKNIHYRRHTPKAAYWSHSMIATAKLFKLYSGKFDKDYFNADPLKSHDAGKARNSNIWDNYTTPSFPKNVSMFSIGARLASKEVVLA